LADEYLTEAFIKSLHGRVVEMEQSVKTILESLEKTAGAARENAEVVKRVAEDTKGIVEMFSALEGGFKVLSGIGKLAKPIFYIASATGAILGVWAAIKSGVLK
jgi:hypothetical protein